MMILKHADIKVTVNDYGVVMITSYHYGNGNGNDHLLQALTASFFVIDPLSSLSISLKIRVISSSLICAILMMYHYDQHHPHNL